MDRLPSSISEKINKLSPEQLSAVDRFLDSLQSVGPGAGPSYAMMNASEPAFAAVWRNPEDAAYDDL